MKRILLLSSILITYFLGIYAYSLINDKNDVIENEKSNNNNTTNNALTMMYETEPGSGEYQISTDTSWPTEGYKLNETLSKCENSGKITWDNTTNKVIMQTNSSDKCYVYFDIVRTINGNATDYNGTYDGSSHSITINISEPSTYQIFYSQTELNEDNYTSGSTTQINRTNAGTTKVYWCITSNGYSPLCGNNNINIAKKNPTFTVSTDKILITSEGTINYTYDGDGEISCEANNVTCEINTTDKIITINRIKDGTEVLNIVASEGINYLTAIKTVTITTTCLDKNTYVYIWDRKKKRKLKRKIKYLKKDDIVYSYDYESGTYVTTKIKNVTINKTKEIYHLIFDNDEIKTTATHAFCIKGMGYVDAALLKTGYEIIGQDGKTYPIKEIKKEFLKEEQDMYCLELDNNNTSFMVGKNGIVCLSMYISALAVIALMPRKVLAY